MPTPRRTVLRRHNEICRARRHASGSDDNYLSCLCALGYGCSHLGVRVYLEGRSGRTAESGLGRLSEADPGDGHPRSHWTAGGIEARNLRRDAELLVRRESVPPEVVMVTRPVLALLGTVAVR